MPTLQDLITDIDARLPNTFTSAQKVVWMQDKLNEIWPHVAFENGYELNTVAGVYIYPLPEYIKIQYIHGLYISQDIEEEINEETGWNEYRYQRPNEELHCKKYFDVLGSLGLDPVPDVTGLKISIIMKKKPDPLDPNNLTALFDFDAELVHILKYDTMQIIAESPPYESSARALYFKGKADEVYNLILDRELRYKVKAGNKARPNKWWRR